MRWQLFKRKPKSVATITASLYTMKDQLAELQNDKIAEMETITTTIQALLANKEAAQLEKEKAIKVYNNIAAILE